MLMQKRENCENITLHKIATFWWDWLTVWLCGVNNLTSHVNGISTNLLTILPTARHVISVFRNQTVDCSLGDVLVYFAKKILA